MCGNRKSSANGFVSEQIVSLVSGKSFTCLPCRIYCLGSKRLHFINQRDTLIGEKSHPLLAVFAGNPTVPSHAAPKSAVDIRRSSEPQESTQQSAQTVKDCGYTQQSFGKNRSKTPFFAEVDTENVGDVHYLQKTFHLCN